MHSFLGSISTWFLWLEPPNLFYGVYIDIHWHDADVTVTIMATIIQAVTIYLLISAYVVSCWELWIDYYWAHFKKEVLLFPLYKVENEV